MSNIPNELKTVGQWVRWRYGAQRGNGKRPKISVSPHTNEAIDAHDAANRSDFAKAAAGTDKVGFVFTATDPFAGIDLDECIVGDQITQQAAAVVKKFNSYTEVSPSGTGLKIFIRGSKGRETEYKKMGVHGCKQVEVYDSLRFFAVTGQHWQGTPESIEDRQSELSEFIAELWPNAIAKTECHGGIPSGDISQGWGLTYESSSALERCRKYLSKVADAVSGQGGHGATLRAACECSRFGLSDAEAWEIMTWFNATKCDPKWSEKELEHKLADARKKVEGQGRVGCRNQGMRGAGANEGRRKYHGKIPQWIRDLKPTPHQKVILQALADQCDRDAVDDAGSLGIAIIGFEKLATESGAGLRTVIRHMGHFIGMGWVVVVGCGGIDRTTGQTFANEYCIPGQYGALKTCEEWYLRQEKRQSGGCKKKSPRVCHGGIPPPLANMGCHGGIPSANGNHLKISPPKFEFSPTQRPPDTASQPPLTNSAHAPARGAE